MSIHITAAYQVIAHLLVYTLQCQIGTKSFCTLLHDQHNNYLVSLYITCFPLG